MAQPVGPGYTHVGTALVDTNLTHDPRTGLPLVDLPPQYEGTLGELRGIVMHWIGPVNKVNANWTSSQGRTGIITDMALYLLNEEGSVRRCLAARDMQELYTTEEQGGLGVRMGGEHSVYMITPPEDMPYMIQCLEAIHTLQTGGRQLPVLQVDRRGLRDLLPLGRPNGWELNMLPMHDKRALAELLARTNPQAPPPPPPPQPPVTVPPPPVVATPPPPRPQPVATGPDPNLLAELERTRRERDLAQRELDKLRADKAKDARNRQLREAFIRQEERLQSLQKQILALQPEEQVLAPVPINHLHQQQQQQQQQAITTAGPLVTTAAAARSPPRQAIATRSRTPTHACHCRETTHLIGQGPRARRETRVTCECTPVRPTTTTQPLLISEGRVGSPTFQRLRATSELYNPSSSSTSAALVLANPRVNLSPPRTAYAVDSPRGTRSSPAPFGSAVGDATARIYAEQERVEMHRAALLAQQRLEHERAQQYEHQRWLSEKMRRAMTRQLAPSGRL